MSKQTGNQKNTNRRNPNRAARTNRLNNYFTSTPSSSPTTTTVQPMATSFNATMSSIASSSTIATRNDDDNDADIRDLSSVRKQTEATICISSGNDDENDDVEQMQQSIIIVNDNSPLSINTTDTVLSEKDTEDKLFNNIKTLIQEFLNRPNRQYPYYRIMRWSTGKKPKMEQTVTIVINQPSII